MGLLVTAVLGVGVAILIGRLPAGTGTGALVVRASVALGIGLILILIVARMLGALTTPPPPSPPTVDATPVDVVYVCTVCGTRLRLEVAATGKAPRHCGEEMDAKVDAAT